MANENPASIVARFHQSVYKDPEGFGFSLFLACCPTDGFPEAVRFTKDNSPQKCYFKACGMSLPTDPNIRKVLVGSWEKDKRNEGSLLFRVTAIRPAPIETERDAVEYLVSLKTPMKGKGASAIVKLYGKDAIEILSDRPNKVAAELKGYSQSTVQALSKKIREDRIISEVIATLHKYEISDEYAERIIKKYPAETAELIDANPYRISRVRGYSFQDVDSACLRYGFTRVCHQRVRAAVLCTADDIKSLYGDVCVPQSEFTASISSLLRVDGEESVSETQLNKELAAEFKKGSIVEQANMVYLQEDHVAEKTLAGQISKFLALPPDTEKTERLESAIKIRQKDPNEVQLAEKQEACLRNLLHHMLILMGGPGSGKTTAAKAVISIYEKLYPGKAVTCLAPTGKAAGRMKESTGKPAYTIHRMLGLKPRGNGKCLEPEKNLPPGLVIIDEFSMVEMHLAIALFWAMPNPKDYTVVIIGDIDQLPSIGPGSVLRDLMNSGEVPLTKLDVVFRQGKDSSIVKNSVKIREKDIRLKYDEETIFMKTRKDADGGYGPTQQLLLRLYKRSIELYGPEETIMLTPRHFRGNHKTYNGDLCSNVMNGLLRDELNPLSPEKKEIKIHGILFREKDRVIQTNRNNGDVNNGEIGIIESIRDTSEPGLIDCEVTIQFDSGRVVFNGNDMADIEHGYAISVHKSQGSEYKCAIIPVLMHDKPLLMRNLIYTALSRAKERAVFVGDEEALSYAIAFGNSRERCTLLAERIRGKMKRYKENQKRAKPEPEPAPNPKLVQFPLGGTA